MFHISGFIDGPKKVGRQNSLGFSLTLTLNFKTEKKNKQTNKPKIFQDNIIEQFSCLKRNIRSQ